MALPPFLTKPRSLIDHQLAVRESARADARCRKSESGVYACSVGHANPRLNRYFNVLPYDRTRVRLPRDAYINANYVAEPLLTDSRSVNPRTWIASQGPLDHTAGDFLSLTCDLEPAPSIIVQLTPLVEQGRPKCSAYVPPLNATWTFTLSADPERQISITRLSTQQTSPYFLTSELEITCTDGQNPAASPRRVTHFQLIDWPDHGVPDDPRGIMELIAAIDDKRESLDAATSSPVLVHCSAGVGRTGTLIVLSSLLRQLPELKEAWANGAWNDEDDPVAITVDAVRDQRAMMIQTADQLAFVRQAFGGAWKNNTAVQ